MRKKFYLYACFGILTVLAIYACTKELDGRDSKGEAGQAGELTVIEAQAYFKDLAANFTLAAFKNPQTRSTGQTAVITPLWNESRTFKIGTTPMVEVPLNVLPGYTCIRKDTMDVAAMNGHASNTMTYLLAQKDDDGDIGYRVASIVADSLYLGDTPEKTLEMSVSKLSDFSGKILYYDVSGELLDGVVYRDGHEVAVIRPAGSAPPQNAAGAGGQTRVNAESYYCEFWVGWDIRCYNVTAGDESMTTCIISNIYNFWICYPMGGGSGGSGGEEERGERPPTGAGGDGDRGKPDPGTPKPEPDPVDSKNTSKILDNSKLTPEQQKKLEEMLKEVMKDCMGGKLYNGLENATNNSRNYTIIFDDAMGYEGVISHSNFEIRLGTEMRTDDNLLHELTHNFQLTEEPDRSKWTQADVDRWNGSGINREMESYLAQYKYLSRQEGFDEARDWDKLHGGPIGQETKILGKMVDNNGQFNNSADIVRDQMNTLAGALQKNESYKNLSYDSTRLPAETLKNLLKLAADCFK